MSSLAVEGTDFVRDENWKPKLRSLGGWMQYTQRKAAKMKPLGFWHGSVVWVDHRDAYRINFYGQEEKIM